MAEKHHPEGINTAMLASIQGHNNQQSHAHSGSDIGLDSPIINSKISLLAGTGEHSIAGDLGLGGNIDNELFASINRDAALARTPINDVGSGTLVSPGNINAFHGMGELKGMGDLSLENAATIGPGVNVASGVSAIKNTGRQG